MHSLDDLANFVLIEAAQYPSFRIADNTSPSRSMSALPCSRSEAEWEYAARGGLDQSLDARRANSLAFSLASGA